MAALKCKMCGGNLVVQDGLTICDCKYCGTKQTIPSADNEKKLNLFNRANRLRLNSEFDKAASIYENIIAEFPEEAEGYWGLVLCNYGIEYVDDPTTARKIPTCHRAAFEPVTKDENYNLAIEYADIFAQKVYRDEAREIDRIMSEILSISKNEEPYDIFICYKETDDVGGRTIDSVIAQDVYAALTDKGYRVFFSRISLEDKLGQQYEPYIFAALNSAKVLLAFGTKYEYYHAVWVKNEWSRFLKIMAKDKSKTLVPCYKDIDPYDMPDEFKALQAQDMGKVGAIQDLLRGIEKLLGKSEPSPVQENPVVNNPLSATVEALLKRAFMFLEDGDWTRANELCEQALNIEPECGKAYIGLIMAQRCVKVFDDLGNCEEPLEENRNFSKALKYSDVDFQSKLKEYNQNIVLRNEQIRVKKIYEKAQFLMNSAIKEKDFIEASELFKQISDFQDSQSLAEKCLSIWDERVTCAKQSLSTLLSSLSLNSSVSDINSKLEKVNEEKAYVRKEITNVETTYKEIADLKTQKAQLENKLNGLLQEKTELGMFSFSQKKAKEAEIEACKNQLSKINGMISEHSNSLKKMSSVNQLNDKLSQLTEKEQKIKDEINQTKAQANTGMTLEDARKMFLDFKYFSIIANDSLIIDLLSKDKELLLAFLQSSSIQPHSDVVLNIIKNREIQNTITSYYPLMRFIISNQDLLNLLPLKLKIKLQIENSSKVFLGSYPQDRSGSKQPIEWIVLGKDDKSAVLLSKYCLDAKQFNSSKENYVVLWEHSEIRKWLNTQFLNYAFNKDEQNILLYAQLPNPAGPGRYCRSGNVTNDRVFFLSYDEVIAYLKGSKLKFGYPTKYAENNGCKPSSKTQETGWWLRTSGDGVCSAYTAYGDKKITFSDPVAAAYANLGNQSDSCNYSTLAYYVEGVRPAILVDLTN